jgi:hypothetical protein
MCVGTVDENNTTALRIVVVKVDELTITLFSYGQSLSTMI